MLLPGQQDSTVIAFQNNGDNQMLFIEVYVIFLCGMFIYSILTGLKFIYLLFETNADICVRL